MCPDGIDSIITIMNTATNEVCVLSIDAMSRSVTEECQSIDEVLHGENNGEEDMD